MPQPSLPPTSQPKAKAKPEISRLYDTSRWAGEADLASVIALAACLFAGALIFLVLDLVSRSA